MKCFICLFIAVLVIASDVGADESSAAKLLALPTHVACIGDSITAGAGASSSAASYPSLLQSMLGANIQVINFGHSGATLLSSGDLPYRQQVQYKAALDFVAHAGKRSRVAVILLLGANDSKPWNWRPKGDAATRADQFFKDYGLLADAFRRLPTHPQVYLALPLATGNEPCCKIDGEVIRDDELPLIRKLSDQRHLPVIDLYTPTAHHPEYFVDGVHPNDAGYLLVARTILKSLKGY